MDILKSIGRGEECVYVYYYPNDKLLAEATGRDVWECKVGMTSTGDTLTRVIAQTSKTSRHQEPVVALELRTNNAYKLESEIHRAFYTDRIPVSKASGDEWFMINPEKVEDYFISGINKFPTSIDISNSYIVDDLSSLATAIKHLRKQKKMVQSGLELPRGTIARLECESGAIQVDGLFKILRKLGCKLVITPETNL